MRHLVLETLILLSILTIAGPSPLADEVGTAPSVEPFEIGVEDVLQIIVWEEEELSHQVTVLPDGRITLPLINEVPVAGLTTEQVRQEITARLAQFVNEPHVTVMILEVNHFRVYFLGEVNTQGPIQFHRPTRLLQAIATAGGLTEFAKKSVTVVREEDGRELRIEVDFKRLWAGEPGQENLYLKPGDTLLVK